MNRAQTNKPEGKGYNLGFSEYLQRYKLDEMDKGDRSRLFQMMDRLPQIEEWRRTLTLTERLKLNHPSAILRKFNATFEVTDPSKPVKPGLRDGVVELSEENMQLKAHVAELEERSKSGIHTQPAQVPRRRSRLAGRVGDLAPSSDGSVEGKSANHREA